MKFPAVIYFLLAALLLNSCQMQKLSLDVYTPPAIELPPDVRGILVTSRFVPAKGDYEAVQWGYYESVDSSLWDLSRYYAESFSRQLDSTERYISKTDFDLRMLRNNNDTLPEALPWLGLLKIVDQAGANGIAILQGFKIERGDTELYEDQPGSFTARASVKVNAAWRISQPERRRMLDENIYSFTKEFTAKGKTRKEAESALPEESEMLKIALDWAAGKYAEVIIPGAEMVIRDYYKDGDIKLEEAHNALLESKWGIAEQKWNFLAYKAENDEVKAKASYNMAMLCERDGRLNQALGFARKANKLMPHQRHIDLINVLTIKMFEEEELRASGKIKRNW